MAQLPLAQDKVWLQKVKYDLAEKTYYENLARCQSQGVRPAQTNNENVAKETVIQPLAQENVWMQKSKYSDAERKHYEKVDKGAEECREEEEEEEDETDKGVLVEPLPLSLAREKVWLQKRKYNEAEKEHFEKVEKRRKGCGGNTTAAAAGSTGGGQRRTESRRKRRSSKCKVSISEETTPRPAPSIVKPAPQLEDKGITANLVCKNSLASEVAKARQHIKSSLQCIDDIAVMAANNLTIDINNRLSKLEKEESSLKQQVEHLTNLVEKLLRISQLESGEGSKDAASAKPSAGASKPASTKPSAPPKPKPDDDDDDDGVDLFGSESEEEDAELTKIKEQRLAEYAAKKSKKPVLIAKSNIILDVKPWDDETDMKKLEEEVRKVNTDGLIWGASKLVPLAYGIHKLQISCVVEDDKVSVDWLQETIQEVEDYVQSVDIAAFNKV